VDTTTLIGDALQLPPNAIGYEVSRFLSTHYPTRALVEDNGVLSGLEEYSRAGHCALALKEGPYNRQQGRWLRPGLGLMDDGHQTWYEVTWQGHALQVLALFWSEAMNASTHYYVLAATRDVAERFVDAVGTWNMELRDEVLVFDSGHWHKDPVLFHAIKGATLDNLVLRGSLKDDIYADLSGFFAARETYERYGVPWKRGVLLVGPPGNGKTHAVKAIVNALARDCLYVKSFRSQGPDEYSIRAVFERARLSAPCILVLEDLDSLITSNNRSFFLNELDGFAGNAGILTLATTNHPERLDPSIVDRPSRFDRKYPFDLPAAEERRAYIAQWNLTLQPELRLDDDAAARIAEGTDGFSFAYLKELFLSATMRWMALARPGEMAGIMAEQVEVLREQMVSAALLPEPDPEPDDQGGGFMPHGSAMFHWGPQTRMATTRADRSIGRHRR